MQCGGGETGTQSSLPRPSLSPLRLRGNQVSQAKDTGSHWVLGGTVGRSTVNRLLTDRRSTVNRQSVDICSPTVGGEDDRRSTVGRLYGNEGDLESWCWQEKELTVSCTSCEDERNALCATRKAADGTLGLDSDFGGKDSIGLVTEDAVSRQSADCVSVDLSADCRPTGG